MTGFRRFTLACVIIICVHSKVTAADRAGVHLFALGDWGIDLPDRQLTADAMAKRAQSDPPDAALLLGDNFYVKLSGIDDPQIISFFEKTYDPEKLNIPFYAVLGNHDYKGGDDAIELSYAARGNTRFKMPARWYRLDLPAEKPLVTVLMLDSDQGLMSNDMWEAELKWIAAELDKPHAAWLVYAAHHDMFGNGNHGDNGVLQTTWGRLFQQHQVDFYLCGHEHTLQHLQIPGYSTSFVVAGGGGAKRKAMLKDTRGPFSKASLGFASIHFDNDVATTELVDETGTTVHAFHRDHTGKVDITLNGQTEKATTKPLKVINGKED